MVPINTFNTPFQHTLQPPPGLTKSLYFHKISGSPRFTPFMSKLIYLNASASELSSMVSIVAGLDRKYQPGRTDSLAPLSTQTEREQMWTLEVSMRTGIH